MNWFANLFRKRSIEGEEPSIDSIRFDTSAWELRERTETKMFWVNKGGDALSFVFVQEQNDLPALSDIGGLRDYARETATSDGKVGGIVSAEVVEMQGLPAFKFIYKYEHLPAYGYTGMVIFPFGRFCYVVAISSIERGITGARDAYVTAQLAESGKLEIEEFEEPASSGSIGRIKGWFRDPYEPEYKGYILRSIADDEKYDSLFPEHPLSKVRKSLERIQDSLSYDESILHPFKDSNESGRCCINEGE